MHSIDIDQFRSRRISSIKKSPNLLELSFENTLRRLVLEPSAGNTFFYSTESPIGKYIDGVYLRKMTNRFVVEIDCFDKEYYIEMLGAPSANFVLTYVR